MSVKIYRGFVIDPAFGTVQGLHHLVSEFRAEVKPLAKRYLLAAFIKDAVTEFDRRHVGLNSQNPDKSPCSHAWSAMLEAQGDLKDGRRHPQYDASCSLALLPHPDGRILGIMYTENDPWLELWAAKPGISEYNYWDNTDRPDDLTAEEWRTRREDWGAVLLNHPGAVPARCGFTADIHDEGFPPYPEDMTPDAVRAVLPKIGERARRLAQETVIVQPADGRLTYHDVIEQMSEAQRSGRMQQETDRLSALIVPEPTIEMLRAEPQRQA